MIISKINIKLTFITIAYVMLSLTLGFIYSDFLLIFLGWNIVLASFAYMLSVFSVYFHKKKNPKLSGLFLIFWILFFPNTFYVLTDFIHFQNETFFLEGNHNYLRDMTSWIVFFHIIIGALYATKLGILSIHQVLKISFLNQYVTLGVVCISSSTAIYIGRFLRFNSWDILKPFTLIRTVFNSLDMFAISFIGMFSLIHLIIYLLFKQKDI